MMIKDISQTEFKRLAYEIFHQGLRDVNETLHGSNVLLEPADVSFQSFLRYISENHSRIVLGASLSEVAMSLYKKAVDDIAFQADEHRFFLREIPIAEQLRSVKTAVAAFQQSDESQRRVVS